MFVIFFNNAYISGGSRNFKTGGPLHTLGTVETKVHIVSTVWWLQWIFLCARVIQPKFTIRNPQKFKQVVRALSAGSRSAFVYLIDILKKIRNTISARHHHSNSHPANFRSYKLRRSLYFAVACSSILKINANIFILNCSAIYNNSWFWSFFKRSITICPWKGSVRTLPPSPISTTDIYLSFITTVSWYLV